jgi:hypothetical protein
VANFAAVWRSVHSEGDEGDERVLGKLFAVSSVTCISSWWIFRADSRDSLASFRQASHIVEIVPTVETKKVPPEINTAGLSHESICRAVSAEGSCSPGVILGALGGHYVSGATTAGRSDMPPTGRASELVGAGLTAS